MFCTRDTCARTGILIDISDCFVIAVLPPSRLGLGDSTLSDSPGPRCEQKHFRVGKTCRSCEGQTQIGAAVVVGLVVLPVIGLVAAPAEGNQGALWVWFKISWQSLRILISLFQVLSALGDALHIAFGVQLRALVELAVFDATSLLRLECIGVQHDFYRLWWLRAGVWPV